jgi:hypothetical protein
MTKHPGGRPKVYSEEELKEIGAKLLIWCRQEGNWHISGFEDESDLSIEFCGDMARRRPEEFSRVYKRAKSIIGRKMMALTMEKSGPSPWMQATLLPMYLTDIDTHLDNKEEKKLIMIEKAKGMAETTVNAAAEKLFNRVDEIAKEKDVVVSPQLETKTEL